MTLGPLTFSQPWILLLAGIVAALAAWLAAWAWRKSAGVPLSLGAVRPGWLARNAMVLRAGLAALAVLAAGIAASGPAWGVATFVSEKKGIDVVVALDLSYSMLAADLTPNRQQAARRVLGEFLAHMDGNRVGLVVFAGKALTLVPPTDDLEFVRDAASRVTFETIDQCGGQLYGTNLSDALALAAGNLGDVRVPGREQAIVVVTDGGKEIRLPNAGSPAAIFAQGPHIFTVGIGKTEGVTLDAIFPCTGGPFPQIERDVRLNVALLQEVAKNGGGAFFQARSDAELSRALVEGLAVLRAGVVEKRETKGRPIAWAALALAATAALGLAALTWKYPTFE